MRGRVLAVVAVIVSVGIAGCGGGSGTITTSTTTASTPPAETVTLPPIADEPDSPVAGVDVVASTLQLDLQRLGYDPGPIGVDFSVATRTALKRFQESAAVPAAEHGALGPATATAFASRLGGANDVVVALQSALTDVDLFRAVINGRYDTATIAAVKALQRHAGIAADGLFGPATAAALAALYRHDDPEPVADAGSSASTTASTTTTAPAPAGGPELLKLGSTGAAVKRLQQRLTALGYRPGPADGTLGAATASAVLAFRKREGLTRDSVVGPAVEAALADPKAAGPPSGPVPRLDIDIARQLVFVVLKGGAVITLNSSTGNGETYGVPGGGSDVAYTPVGDFTVIRKVPGDEHAPLGTLRNPLYFYRGWAIHGAANVPAYPASHGCARISNADADWLFPQISLGTPVIVSDTTGKSPSVKDAPAGAAPGY
jgi:peptidoglycan hydrolase-like protein with peptidoglycan-binding domain